MMFWCLGEDLGGISKGYLFWDKNDISVHGDGVYFFR